MSVFIVGKKIDSLTQKSIVIGQHKPQHAPPVFIQNKLLKQQTVFGGVHAIHRSATNRVVMLGPKGLKEERKIVTFNKKHTSQLDISETQSHKSDIVITSLKEQQAQREQAALLKRQQEEEEEQKRLAVIEAKRQEEEAKLKLQQQQELEEKRKLEEKLEKERQRLQRQQEALKVDDQILKSQRLKRDNHQAYDQSQLEKEIIDKVDLFLSINAPRKKYYSRSEEEKEEIRHWGQRKLLMVEIYFLTTYGHLSKNVIYAGAAPGMHIAFLSHLFKDHKFYLYDPSEFRLQPTDNIQLNQIYFTDQEAFSLKNKFRGDYLFISDVRAANYKELTPLENENQILQENNHQMYWVEIMRPKKSMLKFRCAYPTVISFPTLFFKGEVLIQPWAPQSSTETRLIPYDHLERRDYDNKVYEEQMFYHNDVVRKEFQIPMKSNSEWLDGSWDACAEWYILSKYVRTYLESSQSIFLEIELESTAHKVFRLSEKITQSIQRDIFGSHKKHRS